MPTTFADPQVFTIDGCGLRYWLIGPDDAPVIVCTAGATADHTMFLPQVGPLSERYRLLLWDVRGHGLSQPMVELPTAQRAATDLIALLNHLDIGRIGYIGQSFGGMIGQQLMIWQPDRVIAAMMVGTVSLTMPLSWVDRLGVALTPLVIRLYPKSLFRRQGPPNVALTEDAQRAYLAMLDHLTPATLNDIYTALARSMPPPDPDFRLNVPLLICHGDQDRTGSVAKLAPAWVAHEPEARFALIPDASHNATMDNPAAFNDLALSFFAEFLPRSPDHTSRQ